MRFLVTGGCGFIGSHLCEMLILQGHEALVLDDLSSGYKSQLAQGADFIEGSVLDEFCVAQAMQNIDGCFHLAAISSVHSSSEDWVAVHKINQQGAINVFCAARPTQLRGPIPVVYASSAAVYGDNACSPLSESACPSPVSAYGADKLGCELHARVAWLVYKVPTVGLRFFNVYGPRQNPNSPYTQVISLFIDHILNVKALHYAGDAKQTRDFVYVADVVRFLISSMLDFRDQAGIFNVCTGRSISIVELAKTLAVLAGKAPQITYNNASGGIVVSSLGDPAKAIEKLQLTCETTLAQGLKETIDAELEKCQ